MSAYDLRRTAWAPRGEAVSGQVLCPGPGHRPDDRSLSVRLSATAPSGFVVHSFAGDDFRAWGDHVRGPARRCTVSPKGHFKTIRRRGEAALIAVAGLGGEGRGA
jgi:hypothetical protein